MATIDRYLEKLRGQVDELKARVVLPVLGGTATQQGEILFAFLNRAIQIGEGCLLVGRAGLGTPLFVFDEGSLRGPFPDHLDFNLSVQRG